MALICEPKPSLEDFIKSCTPLAHILALEEQIHWRVEAIAEAWTEFQVSPDPIDNLARFLQADKDFLGIILSITNLSQEKFLRILTAERFARGDFGSEWNIDTIYRKLRSGEGFAEGIARLFLEGRSSNLLQQYVATFYLLPQDWHNMIHSDPQAVRSIIRRKLIGEYTNGKGDAIETLIRTQLEAIRQRHGVTYEQGQVELVGKEVDHVIPITSDPHVLIMTSYMETTSSSQTTRANEQTTMYQAIDRYNIRHDTDRAFVNFVDGAGWLARRSDLRKMYAACHYIINLQTIRRLEAIICKHVPEKYFAQGRKPEVIG